MCGFLVIIDIIYSDYTCVLIKVGSILEWQVVLYMAYTPQATGCCWNKLLSRLLYLGKSLQIWLKKKTRRNGAAALCLHLCGMIPECLWVSEPGESGWEHRGGRGSRDEGREWMKEWAARVRERGSGGKLMTSERVKLRVKGEFVKGERRLAQTEALLCVVV